MTTLALPWCRLADGRSSNCAGGRQATGALARRVYARDGSSHPRLAVAVLAGLRPDSQTVHLSVCLQQAAGDDWLPCDLPRELVEEAVALLRESKEKRTSGRRGTV